MKLKATRQHFLHYKRRPAVSTLMWKFSKQDERNNTASKMLNRVWPNSKFIESVKGDGLENYENMCRTCRQTEWSSGGFKPTVHTYTTVSIYWHPTLHLTHLYGSVTADSLSAPLSSEVCVIWLGLCTHHHPLIQGRVSQLEAQFMMSWRPDVQFTTYTVKTCHLYLLI